MRFRREKILKTFSAEIALIFLTGAAWNQEEEPTTSEVSQEIEEIVVVARKPGDPIDLETRNETLLRARILVEMARLRVLEDEYAWRKLGAGNAKNTSRIKWGYDPRDEMRMRLKSDLMRLNAGNTKPPTIFRIEF